MGVGGCLSLRDGPFHVVTSLRYRGERMFVSWAQAFSRTSPGGPGVHNSRQRCRRMRKVWHEFRDPIHGFIRVSTRERKIIDSVAVQRLRHIHQLSLSYLVYPGATHRRFEHSLGVMELAGRVFDVITAPENLTDDVRDLLPELMEDEALRYWRTVVRLAALLHDVGHLPFSHGAEHELLPQGYSHETLTSMLIMSEHLAPLLSGLEIPIKPEVLARIAVGPEKAPEETFTPWERVMSEVVVSDAFGVDRMDYLLRDSLHAGVQYGRFDHLRLIGSLRILGYRPEESERDDPEPTIGVEVGGLESAEALLIARYMMFTQIYFHRVRLMYDAHLQDFLTSWLAGGKFSIDLDVHLSLTDLEVLAAVRTAARDSEAAGHVHARRIADRRHFRRLYERDPNDLEITMEPVAAIHAAAAEKFGASAVKRGRAGKSGGDVDFPVKPVVGGVGSSASWSPTLGSLPAIAVDGVYIDPDYVDAARSWLAKEQRAILSSYVSEEESQ